MARLLAAILLLAAVWLLAACSDPAAEAGQGRAVDAGVAPDSLTNAVPTPTLAAAITGQGEEPATTAAGRNAAIPKPPTPEVFPSPTPVGAPTGSQPGSAPGGEQTAVPTPVISGEPAGAAAPTPVTEGDYQLPEGATPSELAALGHELLDYGNYRAAIKAYARALENPDKLAPDELDSASYGLGVALLDDGQADTAAAVFGGMVWPEGADRATEGAAASPTPGIAASPTDRAAFQLGQARLRLGDTAGAIEGFSAYLERRPDMAAYVQPLIAEAKSAAGDTTGAIAAYEAALAAPSQRLANIGIRRKLAELYLAVGNYAGAIEQYDGIHDQAKTEITRGEMTYLAGKAELLAGNTEAGYERYLYGVANYPRAVESYWGLVELVDAGVAVDDYQRGVVDFYAGAYEPGIEAFERYRATSPDTYEKKTHLFLAWTYEALGNLDGALAELDAYAAADPAEAGYQRAEMLSRAGRADEAIVAYEAFLTDNPAAEKAPEAAWDAAALAEKQGAANTIDRYLFLAENYPAHADAPEAISRAAWLAGQAGDEARSLELYRRLAGQYPQNEYGAEALVWLMRLAAGGQDGLDLAALQEQARGLTPSHYFAIRARDVADGVAPFSAGGPMAVPDDESGDQAEAETFLRDWLTTANGAAPSGGAATAADDLGALSPALASDPRRIVGEELWNLGLVEEAKAELESLREANAGDPLANYQLALYFRDLGLYRSSIIAAATLLNQVGKTVFDAPTFLGRLSYPAYYADMIEPLAEQYGYDPRLQFALVRQESLFESFARSGAAAQGLSQVIPDTGAWIASRLNWANYVNDDLYKPYVGLSFGAYYLNVQLQEFDNHVHAALAAYNAGPGNAARWYEVAGDDHDGFVDAIDFSETRQYIERIYEGFSAYRHLYGP